MSLPRIYQKVIGRTWLVIRIPDKVTAELCELMECRHDHPRRIAMHFIREGIKRAKKKQP